MNPFDYVRARNPEEAIAAASADPAACYIGGGTNLIDLWKYDLEHPQKLVDVNGLEEGKDIVLNADGSVSLGAFRTNADTAWHPIIESRYPLLSKAILAGASGQIRNMATNGGNLLQRTRCYYFYDAASPCNKRLPGSGCPARQGFNRNHAILGQSDACIAVFPSDMCVALAALEAVVHVAGPGGKRRIPFAAFHRLPGDHPEKDNTLEPGELITAIELPPQGFAQNYTYLKLRDRTSYAFALVSVAVGLELEGTVILNARIALGGVAHKPWRVPEAEDFLIGKTPTDAHFSAAAERILAGAVGYKHNYFKIELARRAIVRACRMALQPESQRPGAQPS